MEYRSLCECACFLVKNHIFTASCSDLEITVACHLCDLVGIHTRTVYYVFCIYDTTVCRLDRIAVFGLIDSRNLVIEHKLSTVIHSISDSGNAKLVRTYYSACLCKKCASKLGIYVGLKLKKLVVLNYAKALDSVGKTVTVKLLDLCSFTLKTYNESLIVFVLNAKTLANALHKLRTALVHARLERTDLGVVACVNYCAVCLCRAHRNVTRFFEYTYAKVVL